MNGFPTNRPLPPEIERKSKIAGLLHGLFLVLFLATVETMIYFVLDARIHDEMDATERTEMSHASSRLTNLLKQQQNEFLFFATAEPTRNCLMTLSEEACTEITSLIKTMMKVNDSIDHVRILDLRGQERIRVNRTIQGRPVPVAVEQLQNKSHKLYFKESLNTAADAYYISALDLNMENNRVETPRKPIIRFGKAVVSPSGRPIGVAIVNFRMNTLLKGMNAAMLRPRDNWYLLNADGYYLRGKSPEKEFTFMYPDALQVGFFSDYPNAWSHFHSKNTRPFQNEQGKFYFQSVDLGQLAHGDSATHQWILVMHVSPKSLAELNALLRMGLGIGALLLMPILATLGWRIGRFQIRQKWYLHELAQSAVTDSLTGLLNHRGVMDKLSPAVAVANRRNSPLVLIFGDVNDLKYLNDRLGHLMGDRLIKGAASALMGTVRQSDIVGRLGGDEFVVGLVDCDISQAIRVMQRVEANLAQMGIAETGKAWTMSWGCTERQPNDTAEQMISRADKQMYAYKTEHKTGRHSLPPRDELLPN